MQLSFLIDILKSGVTVLKVVSMYPCCNSQEKTRDFDYADEYLYIII